MRDCANVEVRDLLPELLHERLGPGQRERVLAHVASCDDCTAELSLLRVSVAASSGDVPRVDAEAIASRVLARLRAAPAPRIVAAPPRRPAWGRGTLRAAAAALLMVVGSGVVLYERGGLRSGAPVAPPAVADTAGPLAAPGPESVAVSTPSAPAAETAARTATPATARPAAQSALGASFGDLSDDELAAVLDAIEATDRGPAADPAPTPTIVTSGEVL
jgi:hypothetical protein